MAGLAGVKAVAPGAGEVVVVSGASGGVGLVSAQLARRAGATVIGLTGPDNAGWLWDRGITAVAYGEGQEERRRAAAQGQPIAAFIDAVGSGYIDLALALGVPQERINTLVDFQAARQHGAKTMGTREAGGTPALRELAGLAASGALDIPIAATYPLDRVQTAYRRVAERRTRGKVVLHPQEEKHFREYSKVLVMRRWEYRGFAYLRKRLDNRIEVGCGRAQEVHQGVQAGGRSARQGAGPQRPRGCARLGNQRFGPAPLDS